MRRVLRVLTRPNVGGPTRQVIGLQHALAERGHESVLAVGQCHADEPVIDLAAAGLRRLDLDALRRGVWPAGGGFVELPDLQRRLDLRRDWLAFRQLKALCRSLRPDIVHTHTSKAGWLGRRAARAAVGAVVAHTFHGLVLADYFGGFGSGLLRRAERIMAARTDVLFAVSESCCAELAEFGITDRCEVTPPAVDLEPFVAARRNRADRSGVLRLGFVGRLVSIKRPGRFLDLLAALHRRGRRVAGHVFGSGPELDGAKRRAVELGVEVAWHGSVVHDFAERLAGTVDAVVFCSRREGWPVAAIEANAAGIPVCGFDVPGVRDALAENDPALLVPDDDVDALAGVVERLAEDVAWRRAVVDRGIRLAERHRPHVIAERLVDAYERARSKSEE